MRWMASAFFRTRDRLIYRGCLFAPERRQGFVRRRYWRKVGMRDELKVEMEALVIAVTALQVLVGRARRASNVEIMKRRDA